MSALLGSISEGTLRLEDLIPAGLSALEALAPEKAESLKISDPFLSDHETGGDVDFDSEEAGWAWDAICDALGDVAPEGYYFGAHPGDGADFGFWRVEYEG